MPLPDTSYTHYGRSMRTRLLTNADGVFRITSSAHGIDRIVDTLAEAEEYMLNHIGASTIWYEPHHNKRRVIFSRPVS